MKNFNFKIYSIEKFFMSLKKNSKFSNFIVCIGFEPKEKFKLKYQYIKFLYMDENQVNTFRKDWPVNRKQFVCLESGEFLNLMDFKDEDIIIFVDLDMVMQRPMSDGEQKLLENLKPNEIGMWYDHLPQVDLLFYYNQLKEWANWSVEEAQKIFDGDWTKMVKCNTGCVVGKVSAWKVIREHYVKNFMNVTDMFGHHSAGQWLLTWIVFRHLNIKFLPPDFHNAHWFHGTLARFENSKLRVDDKIVLFAHTKFAINPTY